VTASPRLVLLVTSPRVAAGLLSSDAWDALRAGPVYIADPAAPAVLPLSAAGVSVAGVAAEGSADAIAAEIVSAAKVAGTATWWVGPDGEPGLTSSLASRCAAEGVAVEVMHGSWDVPGARLLDVVATMDRLRSPGGCPWDAQQDHASLAPYLLEEAYEAFQAIEDSDTDALREELGDVLLQIAFHARLAEELPEDERWTIDDVAGGLVEKLVRRHPHVFAGVDVEDADEVNRNWESIKAAERGEGSALANVPMSAAALTLSATLQRKAARAGATDLAVLPLADAVAAFESAPSTASAGQVLWAVVAACRAADVDAEAALRARAREFRDEHERSSRT
jgi:XTP/dITP diphosphohydrolase